MKDKRRVRLLEWGKSLLILLLALGLVWQLARTWAPPPFRDLLPDRSTDLSDSAQVRVSGAARPVRLAVCRDGQRYGAQYDAAETDTAFAALSTLLSEALGSAGDPAAVSERAWRNALAGTGIYLDFFYSIPLSALSAWLGEGQSDLALTDAARRVCLAAAEDGGVSLLYINEADGLYYACPTTLSRTVHLDAAVAGYSPNGALFAFEVPGMEALAPYTLLTGAPQPAVYAAANPLLEDSARTGTLLSALNFPNQDAAPDPAAGGQIVEGNDSLRLSRDGVVAFHAIGGADARFSVPEEGVQAALNYAQALAETTAGAWCGDARLCLSGVTETADGLEIVFQYVLNGSPVALPEERAAARFVVRDGSITDLTLCLRTYSNTGETSPVLPEFQAAAAMEARNARGKELTLLYQDTGGELVSAGWVAM